MSRVLRILLLLILAAAAIYVLFTWVFPWVESKLENPTLEARAVPASATLWS